MRRLIALYPARWRARYGEELEQLVQDLHPATIKARLAVAADLLAGALQAHVRQGLRMEAVNRTAIRRGALVAVLLWLGLSVEIVLSNVVFPSTSDDDTVSVLISYLSIFVALFVVGVLAARAGSGRMGALIAGAVAGAMIGALTIGTFAVVDNVFLDVVSQQQAKITAFAASGETSMRTFINNGLIGGAVFLTLVFAVMGAGLSFAGNWAQRTITAAGKPPV